MKYSFARAIHKRVHPSFANTLTFGFFITPLKGFKRGYPEIEYLYLLHNWDALFINVILG